jgi:hypothetical protein
MAGFVKSVAADELGYVYTIQINGLFQFQRPNDPNWYYNPEMNNAV